MQLDFATTVYLTHEQNLALKAIPFTLRRIHPWCQDISPDHAAAMAGSIDILENWMPLWAGDGWITIKAARIGEVDIHHVDGIFLLEVVPHSFLTGEALEPQQAILTDGSDVLAFDVDAMTLAELILQHVNLRHERYQETPVIEAWWEQKLHQAPSAKWVALREAALRAGHEPPRACHWMAEQL